MILYKPIKSDEILKVVFYYYEDGTYDIDEMEILRYNKICDVKHISLSIRKEFEIEEMFFRYLGDSQDVR